VTSIPPSRGPGTGPINLPLPRSVAAYYSTERLHACQQAVGYHFRDMSLLENALTHSSVKTASKPSYERMEFLGDSVIGLIIADYIYKLLPDCDEGELTKVKSEVVSTTGLADAANACGLAQFLAVGRGIQMKKGPPKSLVADVFEAVTGAVYLDRGYEAVRFYVLDHLGPFIRDSLADRSAKNFKSVLQQVSQRQFGETPRYEVLRRRGPDHSRVYEVVAVVGGRRFNPGSGENKKDAEQAAAKRALQAILREKMRRSPSGSRSSGSRSSGGESSGRSSGRRRRSRSS
jgi:ribonuclease-3